MIFSASKGGLIKVFFSSDFSKKFSGLFSVILNSIVLRGLELELLYVATLIILGKITELHENLHEFFSKKGET